MAVSVAVRFQHPLLQLLSVKPAEALRSDFVTTESESDAAKHAVEKAAAVDRSLLEDCRNGDHSAFDVFVRRHQRSVWHLIRRYVKNDSDAYDVTQQVFLRAFRGLAGFRGDSLPRSWLLRIAINCSLTWLRDRGRRYEDLSDNSFEMIQMPDAGDNLQGVQAQQRSEQLRAAVTQLPTKQRQVVELRIFDELSMAEIADICQCTENAAKVNFHHAIKRLREIVELSAKSELSRP
jgi:RNA polymerase sigma-70 factor, ECF subfamily